MWNSTLFVCRADSSTVVMYCIYLHTNSFPAPHPTPGLPRVHFLCGATEVLKPERWVFKSGGGVHLSRQQLPLKLAWAISIHKSQVSSRAVLLSVCVHVIEAVLVTPVLSHHVNKSFNHRMPA